MPELPEVETVCRGLKTVLQGQILTQVKLHRADLRFPVPKGFAKALEGGQVLKIDRRSKYILIYLENGKVWLSHLGMSGRFLINPEKREKHTHLEITTGKGDKICFADPRRFGFLDVMAKKDMASHKLLRNLGVEPLSKDFTPTVLQQILQRKKKSPLKAALLDQNQIAGIGNIYASEILHMCGLSPRRAAGTVKPAEVKKLYESISKVLEQAIKAGGSSLKDHRQPSGELGYFQHHFKVYDRENDPCLACGAAVKRIVQSGRSTFYCSHCQH